MRDAWKAVWTLAALAVLLTACTSPTQAQNFEEEVPQVVERVLEAWQAQEPETLAKMFTDEADLWSRTGVWYTGPEEIQRYFEEWMETTQGNTKEIEVDRARQLSERLGIVDVISSLTPREGTPQTTTVNAVVELQPDGSWKFAAWRECPAK